MNRLAAVGLAQEAATGKRVLVLADTQMQAYGAMRHALELVCESDIAPPVLRYRVARGSERIVFEGGGEILFRSIKSNLEGMHADLLYLDHIRDRQGIEKQYHFIRRVSSLGGEVMES